MAGESPDFDEAEFKAGIRGAMLMGMPGGAPVAVVARLLAGEAVPVSDFGVDDLGIDWPTFVFPDDRTADPEDDAGEPYDWDVAPTGDPPREPCRALCGIVELGVTIQSTRAIGTPIGSFDSDRGLVVMFEEEWAAVDGWVGVLMGENSYVRGKQLRPTALFTAGVRRTEIVAQDES